MSEELIFNSLVANTLPWFAFLIIIVGTLLYMAFSIREEEKFFRVTVLTTISIVCFSFFDACNEMDNYHKVAKIISSEKYDYIGIKESTFGSYFILVGESGTRAYLSPRAKLMVEQLKNNDKNT